MIKKSIIVLSTIGILLGGVTVVDYFIDSIDIYDSVVSIVEKIEGDEYTLNNLGSFVPIKVKGYLKPTNSVPDIVTSTKLISGNTLVTLPLYTNQIRDTYNDTVLATDGSFYIAMNKDNKNYNGNKEVVFDTHNLGRSAPKIIEAKIPNSNVSLYIQCYTSEALAFFTSKEFKDLQYTSVALDFSNTTDDIANKINISKSLYPKKENMYLEDKYIDITSSNTKNIDVYSNFIDYTDDYVIYYKAIGFLDTRMKVEYAKLTAMGYTPTEAGTYRGISYIKFKELIVLGKSLTKNSNLIYHVSTLK